MLYLLGSEGRWELGGASESMAGGYALEDERLPGLCGLGGLGRTL